MPRYLKLHAIPIAFLLLGCTSIIGSSQTSRQRKDFVPLVDHHQHLLSSAGAASRLASIALPTALAAVVSEREKNWNKAAGLTGLFVDDAAMFTSVEWLIGPTKIATYLAESYTGPYRFKPASYKLDGNTAQIAGFLAEDDGTDVHFGFFHLNLVKGAGDSWRIKSEIQLFPGPALEKPVTAEQLVKLLDEVGIQRAVVVSDAYYFGAGLKVARTK